MPTALPASPAAPASGGPRSPQGSRGAPGRPGRRVMLWVALVGLLAVGQSLLVMLALRFEAYREQDRAEEMATLAAAEMRRVVQMRLQRLQSLQVGDAADRAGAAWREEAVDLMRLNREVLRIEQRGPLNQWRNVVVSPVGPNIAGFAERRRLPSEAEQACTAAERSRTPVVSNSYFVPSMAGAGLEVLDVCLPDQQGGVLVGYTVGTLSLPALLDEAVGIDPDRRFELSFVEPDGTRLARAGVGRGSGVYVAQRAVDLPGNTLLLRADALQGRPRLVTNITTILVLSLSLALALVVTLLMRDVRRRSRVEAALAEALALRKAMEDSLITGLRARDLDGRITYVNPAFCRMVGQPAEALVGSGGDGADPPYWPRERLQEYRERQISRRLGLADALDPADGTSRQGFETLFMRANGERFPVLIFEAPLVDGQGRQTGWMSTVLDVSEQRRVEEFSRQQQEKLQATARLATVGELASLLSHELNQPLAAINSYATGTLNLLKEPDEQTLPMVEQGLRRMAEQAERAGRVIRSVHDFVRRREQTREPVSCGDLVQGVLPLVRLQARKSGTRIELDIPDPELRVVIDRIMVEQVLLNLTRNAVQAMESATPLARRQLTIACRAQDNHRMLIEVADAGPGIPEDVARQLFNPFFTTREDGMGLGLSLCRTVAEQHGDTLSFDSSPQGCRFRFTVPLKGEGGSA